MTTKLMYVLGGIIICLVAALWALYTQNTKLEASIQTLELSNVSLQKYKENNETFIAGISQDLQLCLDSKAELSKKFTAINYKYRQAKTEKVRENEVLHEDLRKDLRNVLNKPLPFAGVQQ